MAGRIASVVVTPIPTSSTRFSPIGSAAIGPLEKRLGVRPLDVRVDDHVVFMNGEVAHLDDAAALERAVQDISGVAAVRSHLRVAAV